MSFLQIENPSKRDAIVNEFLKTKRNIQLSNLSERVGDIEMKREFSKVFAPITESTQKAVEAVREIPTRSLPSIEMQQIGPTAAEYLKKYLGTTNADKTFGIYSQGNKFFIGNKEIKVDDDDIIIGEDKYEGTPGLWELITSRDPQNYLSEDRVNYARILFSTNAMQQNNDPNNPRPKSSKGKKYIEIIKPIWESQRSLEAGPIVTFGNGFLPSDSNALIQKLALLIASKEAGNTGVVNEIVSITDELYRQKVIDNEQYKKLQLKITL